MWREPMRTAVSIGVFENRPRRAPVGGILCDPGRVTTSNAIDNADSVDRGDRLSDAMSAAPTAPALATTVPQPNEAAAKLTQESL